MLANLTSNITCVYVSVRPIVVTDFVYVLKLLIELYACNSFPGIVLHTNSAREIYLIMSNCGKCSKTILSRSGKNVPKIECIECKQSFHGKCVDLTPEDIKFYEENDTIWRCQPCSTERRKSMAIESAPKSAVTYDDVVNLVSDLRKDIKGVENSLGVSINSAFEEIKETKNLVSKQNEDMSALLELVNKLSTENVELKNRVSALESRMDDIEQYSRRDTIEIHGVPVAAGEQVVEVVKSVVTALDLPIEDTMISACHRLRSREGTGKPPGIIVKMVRRMDAQEILKKRRVKRNFSTHHIGLTANLAVPIYINESLCPGRRRLLNAAKNIQKEKHYTFLWIRDGKILLRKSDKDPVKVVTSPADLDKL